MLRFDVPQVWSNVTRWEAFVTWSICLAALAGYPWLMVLPALQGLVRGFVGHHRCPSHLLWKRIAERQGWAGRRENAGARMFANKILFVAASVALALFLAQNGLWRVPVAVLLAFSLLEWAFSFCAACWVYGAWYQRFPPGA
jgi:hypothetical protein